MGYTRCGTSCSSYGPTLEASQAYRYRMNGSGWADIWAVDDQEESRESPAPILSACAARVLDREVPPERLALAYAPQ
jgi:hypothetical protein